VDFKFPIIRTNRELGCLRASSSELRIHRYRELPMH
jgi:hypothetical protein